MLKHASSDAATLRGRPDRPYRPNRGRLRGSGRFCWSNVCRSLRKGSGGLRRNFQVLRIVGSRSRRCRRGRRYRASSFRRREIHAGQSVRQDGRRNRRRRRLAGGRGRERRNCARSSDRRRTDILLVAVRTLWWSLIRRLEVGGQEVLVIAVALLAAVDLVVASDHFV